jgi:predicted acyl esterase
VFSTRWHTSPRRYGVVHERNVAIPVSAGITIDCDIFRPDAPGEFPVILGVHGYSKDDQLVPMMPTAMALDRGHIEAGDPNFYVRRGYVHVIANIRGTGKSGGSFVYVEPEAIRDVCDVIEWLAKRPWSNGRVGMFGASFFSVVAKLVAAQNPPSLKCVFAPFGSTDVYRDRHYHGGIMSYRFLRHWTSKFDRPKLENALRKKWGEEKYRERVAEALADPEIAATPYLVEVLRSPDAGRNQFIAAFLLNPLDGEFFRSMSIDVNAKSDVAGYFGGCWGIYGLHLPGDFRSFETWSGPKRLTIGPPAYLDRPIYQYHYESLRWFDHYLKGMETGLADEAPVQLFIEGTGEWKAAGEWPLPETRWTPFYLHAGGLLSEHEFWPNEGASTFEESTYGHGKLEFRTPPLRENTEVCGPMVVNLYGSTTDSDVLWFVSVFDVDPTGAERLLTRGWLRGSQRRVDPGRSKPWQPWHPHDRREPLAPNQVYEFNIEVRPYGMLFKAGHRIGLRIKCADDEAPADALHAVGSGHIWRATASRVTVHHDAEHPSHILLPITRGNRIGSFMSGGVLPRLAPT